MDIKWSYGITAVHQRYTLLVDTVKSLSNGGFKDPILFIDGRQDHVSPSPTVPPDIQYLRQVYRERRLHPFANFVLGMWELYLRDTSATYYAMFQDDLVCYKNLRAYLENCDFPERGFWNLYTWPCNVKENLQGWSLSDQWGRGAVALVFSNNGLRRLFKQDYFINHRENSSNGHKSIDKAVMMSHRHMGWQEWIHNPSLVQHTGTYSTCKNTTHPISPVFYGEEYDAVDLLRTKDNLNAKPDLVDNTAQEH